VSQALRITYLHTLPWETEPWKSLIARNSPGNGRIGAPILIAQGEADRLILPSITKAFVGRLCRQGETLDYCTYRGVDHVHAGPETAADIANWIADRLRASRRRVGAERGSSALGSSSPSPR
jgi:hypothetical protein